MKRLVKHGILPSLPDIFEICVKCVKGQLTKTKKEGSIHSQYLLEIIHTNISGLSTNATINDLRYLTSFIDDFLVMLAFSNC